MTTDSPKAIPSAKIKKAPDLFEPILAYRHWDIEATTGLLLSPMNRTPKFTWGPDENLAKCPNGGTACMESYCACGLYGVFYDTHSYFGERYSAFSSSIRGVIAAYGRVNIGTRGLRAEKAKIVALHLPATSRWAASRQLSNRIRENYPDVRLYREVSNLIAAEGVHVPEELFRYQADREYG